MLERRRERELCHVCHDPTPIVCCGFGACNRALLVLGQVCSAWVLCRDSLEPPTRTDEAPNPIQANSIIC